MSIFSIKPQQQDAFINAPEIYQGVQSGYFQDDQDQGYCIVVNAMIGIDLRGDLRAELDYFVGQTWRPTGPLRGFNYEQRYQIYWENLKFYYLVLPVLIDRASLPSTLTFNHSPTSAWQAISHSRCPTRPRNLTTYCGSSSLLDKRSS